MLLEGVQIACRQINLQWKIFVWTILIVVAKSFSYSMIMQSNHTINRSPYKVDPSYSWLEKSFTLNNMDLIYIFPETTLNTNLVQRIVYNPGSVSNQTITQSILNGNYKYKSLSGNCIGTVDTVASPNNLLLYKYNRTTSTYSIQSQTLADQIFFNFATQTFVYLSDDCNTIVLNSTSQIFRWNDAQATFLNVSLRGIAPFTKLMFNMNNFSLVYDPGSDGIQYILKAYNYSSGSYAQIKKEQVENYAETDIENTFLIDNKLIVIEKVSTYQRAFKLYLNNSGTFKKIFEFSEKSFSLSNVASFPNNPPGVIKTRFSPSLERIFFYQQINVALSKNPLFIGFRINYALEQVSRISLTDDFYNYANFRPQQNGQWSYSIESVSNDYIYFKIGINNTFHRIYRISSSNSLALFYEKQYFYESFREYLVTTDLTNKTVYPLKHFISDSTSQSISIIHAFRYKQAELFYNWTYLFDKQQINYLDYLIEKNSQMNITYNNTDIYKTNNNFRWIFTPATYYDYYGITNVTAIAYNSGFSKNKQQFVHTFSKNMTLLNTAAQAQDCAILYNSTSKPTAITLLQVNYAALGTMSPTAVSVVDPTILTKLAQVSTKCLAFRVTSQLYLKNSVSGLYIKDASSWSGVMFDATLKFFIHPSALNGLWHYDGIQFIRIITPSFGSFYENNVIIGSSDQKRAIVLSYNNVIPTCSFLVGVFALNESTSLWQQVSSNLIGTSANNVKPQLTYSPLLDVISVKYASSSTSHSWTVRYVDYTNNAISTLTIPNQQKTSSSSPTISISQNYIYYKKTLTDNSCQQNFFYISQQQPPLSQQPPQLISMYQMILNSRQNQSTRNIKLLQTQTNLYVMYEIQRRRNTLLKASNQIILVKKQIGLYQQLIKIKNIETFETQLIVTSNAVALAVPGCQNSFNQSSCLRCFNGFWLNLLSGRCERCALTCRDCDLANASYCTSCYSGYFIKQKSCTKCHKSCTQCSDQTDTSCTACPQQYFLTSGQCIACPENCIKCFDSSVCQVCRPRYTLSESGKCVQCMENCQYCDPTNLTQCLSCRNGYYLINILNQQSQITSFYCKKCPNNCTICSQGVCSACVSGLSLNTVNNKCIQKCRLPCKQCNQDNPTKCVACVKNYVLSGSTCLSSLGCVSSKSCTSCPTSYNYNNNGNCQRCTISSSCKYCSFSNKTICLACQRNYQIQYNSITQFNDCLPKLNGCDAVFNNERCLKCLSGYSLVTYGLFSKCVQCKSPCATCSQSSIYECQSCVQNYSLKDWKCVSNNYITISVKVHQAQPISSIQSYYAVIRQICSTIQRPYDDFNLQQIHNEPSNEAIITGTINTASSSESSLLIDRLNTVYYQGSALSSFYTVSILLASSQLQYYSPYPQISPPQTQSISIQSSSQQHPFNIFTCKSNSTFTTFKRTYAFSTQFKNIIEITHSFGYNLKYIAINQQTLNCGIFYYVFKQKYYAYRLNMTSSQSYLNNVNINPSVNSNNFPIDITNLIGDIDSVTDLFVGDQCNAIRVNNFIYRISNQTNIYRPYKQYKPPTDSDWLNPIFNKNLSIAVTNTAIYIFNQTLDKYTLIRTDSFYNNKQVYLQTNRLLIFSYSSTSGVHNYKVQINLFKQDNFTIISQFSNQTSNAPKLHKSPLLSKVIVQGKIQGEVQGDSQIHFQGKNIIDYELNKIKDIVFTQQFYTSPKYIKLGDDYIYIRDLEKDDNNKIYQRGYTMISYQLFLSFSSLVNELEIQSKSKVWMSLMISKIDMVNLKISLISVYSFDLKVDGITDGVWMQLQSIDLIEIKTMAIPEIIVPAKEYIDTTKRDKSNYRWTYTEGDGSTIVHSVSYDWVTQQIIDVVSPSLTGSHVVVGASSKSSDCVITLSKEQNLMYVIFFDFSTKTSKIIDNIYTQIVQKQGITQGNMKIEIISQCKKIKINQLLYIYNESTTSSPFYYQSTEIGTIMSAMVDTTYQMDSTLKVMVIGNNLYQLASPSSSSYNKIYDSLFYKSNQIYYSPEQDKIVVLTYQQSIYPYQQYAVRVFAKSSSNLWWQSISTKWIGDEMLSNNEHQLIASPNYNIILLQKPLADNYYTITIRYINYTSKIVTKVSIPAQLNNILIINNNVIPYIELSNSYLYVKTKRNDLNDISVQCNQLFYLWNQTSLSYMLLKQKILTQREITTYVSNHIFQDLNTLKVIYQVKYSLSTDSNVYKLFKKQITSSLSISNQLQQIHQEKSGFYLDNQQYYLCSPGCKSCANTALCQYCADGFIYITKTSKCQRCNPLCKSCSINDFNKCLDCYSGFYISISNNNSTWTCAKCHQDCLECSSFTNASCTQCKIGYFLFTLDSSIVVNNGANNNGLDLNNNSCMPCARNCLSCKDNITCLQCITGYGLSQFSQCVKCPITCTVCDPGNLMNCSSCQSGYQFVIANHTSQCRRCPINCRVCKFGVCSQCQASFRLSIISEVINNNETNITTTTTITVCSKKCKIPCKSCESNNQTKCLSCFGGYVLNQQQSCVPNISCSNDYSCTNCAQGYTLLQSVCFQCQVTANCKTCNVNITKCIECLKGYYLTQLNQCHKCSKDCLQCQNQLSCSECSDGYTLSTSQSSIASNTLISSIPTTTDTTQLHVSKCIQCQYPFKTCSQSPSNYKSCIDGYSLNGWTCVSDLNIRLKFTLNYNYSLFEADNYIEIQKDLSEKSLKSVDNINLVSYLPGSVIVDLMINVHNIQDYFNTLQKIKVQFGSPGKTIANFSIKSMQVLQNPIVASSNKSLIQSQLFDPSKANPQQQLSIQPLSSTSQQQMIAKIQQQINKIANTKSTVNNNALIFICTLIGFLLIVIPAIYYLQNKQLLCFRPYVKIENDRTVSVSQIFQKSEAERIPFAFVNIKHKISITTNQLISHQLNTNYKAEPKYIDRKHFEQEIKSIEEQIQFLSHQINEDELQQIEEKLDNLKNTLNIILRAQNMSRIDRSRRDKILETNQKAAKPLFKREEQEQNVAKDRRKKKKFYSAAKTNQKQ